MVSIERRAVLDDGERVVQQFGHAGTAWPCRPRRAAGPKPIRTLAEIRADILALEQETEGLLAEILGGGEQRETTT